MSFNFIHVFHPYVEIVAAQLHIDVDVTSVVPKDTSTYSHKETGIKSTTLWFVVVCFSY